MSIYPNIYHGLAGLSIQPKTVEEPSAYIIRSSMEDLEDSTVGKTVLDVNQ